MIYYQAGLSGSYTCWAQSGMGQRQETSVLAAQPRHHYDFASHSRLTAVLKYYATVVHGWLGSAHTLVPIGYSSIIVFAAGNGT